MALCVAEKRQIKCNNDKFILENLIEANLKSSLKNKLYMSDVPMLTRIAYQALGMIEDLPAAGSQASLIQHARFVPKAVKTTTTTASSRTTRSSKKSSSDDERMGIDKDQDSKESDKEDSQKGVEAQTPSEHEPSDQEDTSTPLDEKKNQEPASTVASTSDSATLRTLIAMQEQLQTEKLQRQLLVSGFMTQTAQHEVRVKKLNQAEIHLHVHLQPMPDMPDLPSTSQHDEEQQGPPPGALDVRGDLEQDIENMPEGSAKEFLLHEKKVMESAALAFLQLEGQVNGFGHEFLPLPLMKHEAILWKEKMRPALPRNDKGGYKGIPLTVEQAQVLVGDHPKWRKKWLQERPNDLTQFHNTPQALQIDPTYYPVPRKRTWLEFQSREESKTELFGRTAPPFSHASDKLIGDNYAQLNLIMRSWFFRGAYGTLLTVQRPNQQVTSTIGTLDFKMRSIFNLVGMQAMRRQCWPLLMLTKEISLVVQTLKTVKEMWSKLARVFDRDSKLRAATLLAIYLPSRLKPNLYRVFFDEDKGDHDQLLAMHSALTSTQLATLVLTKLLEEYEMVARALCLQVTKEKLDFGELSSFLIEEEEVLVSQDNIRVSKGGELAHAALKLQRGWEPLLQVWKVRSFVFRFQI
ncbi:hypothetical protein L7F22_059399 [Adiantum nelumboides]|nr:hypothetical protein [Adiantum nelumboides]